MSIWQTKTIEGSRIKLELLFIPSDPNECTTENENTVVAIVIVVAIIVVLVVAVVALTVPQIRSKLPHHTCR